MMDAFMASLFPGLTTLLYLRHAQAMAEGCVAEQYRILGVHYAALLDDIRTSLRALAYRPDWVAAWELGMRWISRDPYTVASQETMHSSHPTRPTTPSLQQLSTKGAALASSLLHDVLHATQRHWVTHLG